MIAGATVGRTRDRAINLIKGIKNKEFWCLPAQNLLNHLKFDFFTESALFCDPWVQAHSEPEGDGGGEAGG